MLLPVVPAESAFGNPGCISFEDAGGYVAVSIVDEDNHRTVES